MRNDLLTGSGWILAAAVLGAGIVGVVAGGTAVWVAQSQEWLCETSSGGMVCPDGIARTRPGTSAVTACIALAVAVAGIARGLDQLPASIAGRRPGATRRGAHDSGGAAPVLVRRFGRRAYVASCVTLALAAFALAAPAILIAALLAGYGLVLLLGAAVAVTARRAPRPFGSRTA
ncbi:MAG: hypothetical protein GEV03_18555 [Streptosporangiales bacterium]|nr:hypothetical protein [Streptosporangiales bacterium]